MNTSKLRSKRIILPTVAAVAILGVGGGVWAATADSDDLSGSERSRVETAAVEAAGGGTVTDAETSDDPGEAYEVEVRTEDGREVEVTLDEDLALVGGGVVEDDLDDRDDDRDDDGDDSDDDGDDRDDQALSDAERRSAEKAALAAVGGGTVTDVEASDDRGEAYEVEVRAEDGVEWDVDLDADFEVLRKRAD